MESQILSRPSLPPIHSLDVDKYSREETDYHKKHSDMSSVASTMASNSYPSGPPPPYSAASHAPSTPSTHAPTLDSRQHTVEDKDQVKPQTKQSLPSLQEALGGDKHTSATSPESVRPPHNIDTPYTSSYGYSHQPYSQSHRDSRTYSERRSSEHEYPPYGRHYHQQPSPVSSHAPRPDVQPYAPSEHQTHYERTTQPHSTQPMTASSAAPHSREFSYGYTPYPARYAPATTAAAPPPHALSSGSSTIYQPSVSAPPPQPQWRPDHSASVASRDPAVPYEPAANGTHTESVKRHLDMFDFEVALNEIAEYSTITLDFSRSYGARLHQQARTGPVPGSLPAITEVEELMNKSKYTMEALIRMRESLIAQQAAYLQQAQEQRFKTENEAQRNDSVHQSDDRGGFAGPEPKKRRGRAAAPGRCHSCNRAETPEWRRGPDGARTLCNACGLHYAKLTRKAGAKAAIGSSNLRPKSHEREGPESQSSN